MSEEYRPFSSPSSKLIPDFIDDDNITKDSNEGDANPNVVREVSMNLGWLTVQVEDFGGGLPMLFMDLPYLPETITTVIYCKIPISLLL